MTTLIRVEPPVASRSSKIIPATSYGESSSGTSLSQTKLTFSPVTTEVLSEIMGYTTLGLSDIANNQVRIPSLIYKWHTWLIRMNNWMNANKNLYPQVMDMPQVSIPADLYFMSDTNNNTSISDVAINAAQAPLGPLLPADYNTFVNALNKGLQKCTQDGLTAFGNITSLKSKRRNYVAFVKDVNKIALYAIQSENGNLESSSLTIPISSLNDESTTIIPLPPSVKTTVNNIIEHFNKDKQGILSKIPIWAWVAILMIVIYFFTKDARAENFKSSFTTSTPSAPEWNSIGGARVFDISDFQLPQ